MARTPQQLARFEVLRAQAITLRAAGKSRAQIKELLNVGSDGTLNELLRDVIPPGSPLRANAKDDMRARARELRLAGRSYNEIVSALGVSKSSVSLWVRDLPEPSRLSPEQRKRRAAEGVRRYWETERDEREARRRAIRSEAAAMVGPLSEKDLLVAGAVAYWCEGGKNKPGRRYDRVVFMNSDPGLIRLFLRFLGAAGVDPEDVAFHVCIHETADLAEAERFWLEQTGGPAHRFGNPIIKRHRPATARSNVGEDYHGCLRVEVRRGAWLYRKIEGWVEGIFRDASIESAEPALDR
ncbi:hypothetical protein [Microtetraspora niveoalba]|uniref:hypothetical protein n=1 Tax=Microtetraspora niveoalba TaxID=46175 RepID=UPI0008297A94|nr:hypothetical protein [Microtetraspora niveoalba]